MFDVERSLLAQAPKVKNRLYLLEMQLAAPVCLVSKADDVAWLWHDRYGHLNSGHSESLVQREWWKVYQCLTG